jgi:hypothetical protein
LIDESANVVRADAIRATAPSSASIAAFVPLASCLLSLIYEDVSSRAGLWGWPMLLWMAIAATGGGLMPSRGVPKPW